MSQVGFLCPDAVKIRSRSGNDHSVWKNPYTDSFDMRAGLLGYTPQRMIRNALAVTKRGFDTRIAAFQMTSESRRDLKRHGPAAAGRCGVANCLSNPFT